MWPASPPSLQRELLEDDRLLRHFEGYQATLREEIEWVEALDMAIWDRMTSIVGGGHELCTTEIRSATLQAVFAEAAYIQDKIFSVALSYPWSLAVGDIADNLASLLETGYDGDDQATLAILNLLKMGYNRGRLADAVCLLREIPWTTMAVEQAHGYVAVIHRLHPALTSRVLCHRTLIHQCRALFNKPPEERCVERLCSKMEKMRALEPQRAKGRQIFLRDLFQATRKALPAGSAMAEDMTRAVMKRHASAYARLPEAVRRQYDREAQDYADQKASVVVSDLQEVFTMAAMQRRRLDQEAFTRGVTNRLSDHRFQDSDLLALAKTHQSAEVRGSVLANMRAKALAAPEAPTVDQQKMLEVAGKSARLAPPALVAPPHWLRVLCANREQFRQCGLFCEDLKQGGTAYMFLYASQNPIEATFLEVRRVRAPRAYELSGDSLGELASSCWAFEFDYKNRKFVSGRTLNFETSKDLSS